MTATLATDAGPSVEREPGSSLAGSALVSAVLFAASLVVGVIFAGSPYSSPFGDDATLRAFYTDHATLLQWVAFLQFGSAIALAVFTGVLVARLRKVAPGFPALAYTAAAGGVMAALFLGLNSVVQWSMSHQGVIESDEVRRGLHYLFFGLGGFAHVASIGVLVGAVSIVALRARLLPRWLVVVSLVVAVLALASPFTFVTESTTLLIPLGRFPALLWQVAVAFMLPAVARSSVRRGR
jgi:hypothetical protein